MAVPELVKDFQAQFKVQSGRLCILDEKLVGYKLIALKNFLTPIVYLKYPIKCKEFFKGKSGIFEQNLAMAKLYCMSLSDENIV